jgi:3',5'-cyclic AMP phosphodiesterase CpdA
MRFVVLTDTHFLEQGRTNFAIDPAARLASAIEIINRDHPDIAFVMITGDLAHWGQFEAYTHLKATLASLRAPVLLMMGNHDRRMPFREVFPDQEFDSGSFVQSLRIYDSASLIVLDTLDEEGPSHAGVLCPKRMSFLEAALRDAPQDRPLLLFQHHPPFVTGLPHMDRIMMRNGAEETALFARTRRPDFMFMGHVHRPIGGVWQGVPFHIQRALAHQVAFDLRTKDRIPGTLEPPDYSLVTITGQDIVIHTRSFLYDGPNFWMGDPASQAAKSIADLPS